jgi:hypothetical protein
MASDNSQKIPHKYTCIFCNYNTISKKDFNKHISTDKHKRLENASKMLVNPNELSSNINKMYLCNCGKSYTHDSSYYRQKKKFKTKEDSDSEEEKINDPSDKELMLALIKDNSELKNMIMEIVKNGTHNTTNNNTNTNSHNKAFNLNFFLNETCKDAMNIMDFVDSIKLQLSDLEKVGELGYVEGISNIIVQNLKELDVNKRPVHCTDKKRETMYVKDSNKWEKDEEKLKLHKVVRKVTCKNQNLISKFKEIHPEYNKYHSKISDQYNKIVVESMGGTGDNDYEKEEKIIKNISKQVFIDKI